MINNQTNIFEYATKELSQDAVFMYLLDCYNSSCPKEKDMGQAFLTLLYNSQNAQLEKSIKSVIIKKQYHNIDVLFLSEYDDCSVDVFIIEDKTYTSQHNNQLQTYYEDIHKNGIENKKVNHIYGVYFKLGQANVFEKAAFVISNSFEYKLLEYTLFLDFLDHYKETNQIMKMVYDFYKNRLSYIKKIDETDFDAPEGLCFSEVLSNGYSQNKYMSWLIKEVLGDNYHEVNQYSIMNYGQPCTQYRFVFTKEDESDENWNCKTDGNISNCSYIFRIDKNSAGWYISINQYNSNGDKNWDAKKQVRDELRAIVKSVLNNYGLVDNTDNRGKKESKICLFNINSFDSVKDKIPVLQELYKVILSKVVEK